MDTDSRSWFTRFSHTRLTGVCLCAAAAWVSGAMGQHKGGPEPLPPEAVFADLPVGVPEQLNTLLHVKQSRLVVLNTDPMRPGMPFSVQLPLGGSWQPIQVGPYAVLSPDCDIQLLTDNGWQVVKQGDTSTFRGEVIGLPGSMVAGGIVPGMGICARIIVDDEHSYWIEPLSGRPDAPAGLPAGLHAIYTFDDAISIPNATCGNTEPPPTRAPIHEHQAGGTGGPRGAVRFTAQLATDCDTEFIRFWGGQAPAQGRIGAIINTMNLACERDVDITHVITTQRFRLIANDGYTSTVPATVNSEIASNWAGESFTNIDVIQLFTGKDIDGSVIGRANAIGSICGNQASNCFVQSDFDGQFMSATDLSQHELGHLWDASHCTCSAAPNRSTMNATILSINRFTFSNTPDSVSEIVAYRGSRSCLTTAAAGTAPPNDACADAVPIDVGEYGYSTVGATNDGPPAACGSAIGRDIWYTFTAPCDGRLTIDTCNAQGYDSYLVGYSGSCGSLTELDCSDDLGARCFANELRSLISFATTRATVYTIRVGGHNGAAGHGILSVSYTACPTPPPNDECAGVITVDRCDSPIAFDNRAATDSHQWDGNVAGCYAANDGHVGHDLWYRYVASCTGTVTLSTCGSSFDTKIHVYNSCPTGPNQAIACNDDNGPECSGLDASLAFPAVGGADYIIAVGGYNQGAGTGTLTIISPCAAGNDLCSNAVIVPAGGGTFMGDLLGGCNDGTGSCGFSAGSPDLWYSFTACYPGLLTVTTCGTHDGAGVDTGMDTVLTLFDACGGAELACNDDAGGCDLDTGVLRDSRVTTTVSTGQMVFVRVASYSGGVGGPFVLTVVPTLPSDTCANAAQIFDGETTVCNAGATLDGAPGCRTGYSDIWFTYVATCTGSVVVDTCAFNGFDTVLFAYSGACGSLTELACNDDACGSDALASRITFNGIAGTIYRIRVASYSSTLQGLATVTIACTPAGGACCCGSSCTNVAAANLCTSPGGGMTVAFVPSGNCNPFSVVTPCCRADFNRTGGAPSSQDIFDFLAAFFSTSGPIKACADFNGNPPAAGGVSSQDIFDFLAAFFRPGGCSP